MKKILVLSLGGSTIIPNKVNTTFLKAFKKIIHKHEKTYKFIIVTGGGHLARDHIKALKQINASKKIQSLAGISATRNNARFMNYFFNREPKNGIPLTLQELQKDLKKMNIIFCGGLGYKANQTSDATAAHIARYFKTEFVNITNVDGLFTKDPKKHNNAKLIPIISYKQFYKMTTKTKFNPGQHFVLDQTAAKIIMQHHIKTTIIGNNPKNLDNFLSGKKFKGTLIGV